MSRIYQEITGLNNTGIFNGVALTKMSQQRRQYLHPKTPNKLLNPSILQQSIPSSFEMIEAFDHLKT